MHRITGRGWINTRYDLASWGHTLCGSSAVPGLHGEANSIIFKAALLCDQTQADLEKKAWLSMTLSVIHNYRTSTRPHECPPPQNSDVSLLPFLDRSHPNKCLSSVTKCCISSLLQHWGECPCPLVLRQGFPNFPNDKDYLRYFLKGQNWSSQLRPTEPQSPAGVSAPEDPSGISGNPTQS